MGKLLAVLFCFHASVATAQVDETPSSWSLKARELFTGDEAKISAAKAWFQNHPEVLSELSENLPHLKDPHLALDAMVALGHREVMPYLMEHLEKNTDGSYALALAAFMDEESAPRVLGRFKQVLERSPHGASPPLALVLIDTLARLNVPLSASTMDLLFTHPWPEVRSSLLQYVRKNKSSGHFLETLLQDKDPHVRLGALHAAKELSWVNVAAPQRVCSTEQHPLVLTFCQQHFPAEPEA